MSVDVAALEEELRRARSERARLDGLIEWLEEGIGLLAPVAPPKPAAPKATVPRPARPVVAPVARPSTRDLDAQVLAAALHAGRPLSSPELAVLAKTTAGRAKDACRRLAAAGKLAAEGNGRWRRYRAAPQDAFHSEHRAASEASKAANAKAEDDAIARIKLRDQVLKAICATPGGIGHGALCKRLGATVAEIGEATDWLLARRRIERDEDGAFIRARGREIAA